MHADISRCIIAYRLVLTGTGTMSFNLLPTSPSRTEKSSMRSIKHASPCWTLSSPGLEHELNGSSLLSACREAGDVP
jgi:hypothetical protein